MSKELKDTIPMMQSDDFKERFKAEYEQTKIRHDKLNDMLVKMEAGTLHFEPKCPASLFKEQRFHMHMYLDCLKRRAKIEGIEL